MATTRIPVEPSAWQRLVLHPLLIRRITGREYTILRADGRGGIRTRALGAETVRLLRQVESVRAARVILERDHGTRLDFTPLLESLARAGLVREADGVTVNADALAPLDIVRCFWRCQIDWAGRAPKWLGAAFPPGLALPLIRATSRRRIALSAHARGVSRVAAALPSSTTSKDAATQLHKRHLEELAHTDSLARMVCTVAPAALARWIERKVRVEGLDHVTRARDAGRGVIIAGLHAGAYPITIPTLLWAGVPFHTFNFGMRLVERKPGEVFAEHSRTLGWAESQFYYEPTQRNISRYVREVRGGGVGLVMPDYFAPDAVPASGRRTEVSVPFGDRRILIHAFAGWLARTTGALVIPAEARREARGGFRVCFGPAMDPTPSGEEDGDAGVTRRIFGLLAPSIVQSPEHWNFLGTCTQAPGGEGESPVNVR
jgi:lauroyl/myristoyl acyltransferase